MAEEPDQKALPLGRCSSILIARPLKTTPPKPEREVSMTMEVRSLLSRAMLDMPGCGSGNSTPKRPNPMVILTPPPHKLRDLTRLVDTSSQVSTPDNVKMVEASLEEVPTTIFPIAVTPGSRSITPPTDTGQLWEKANKALEELLATKSSIDACRLKVVWELGMELCQNNSETVESIKEARAIRARAAMDAEALCSTTVKEAKATCTCIILEAETICSVAIRNAETQGASQADSLHRQHAKTIKHLEEQVIQEEGKSQINFLSACQAALQTSPVELRGALVASYHILMGQAPMSHPFTLSQGASPTKQPSAPAAPSSLAPEHSPRPKRQHPSPDPVDDMPLGWTTSKTTSEGPPSPKQWEIPPWYKVLKQSCSEVFSCNTSLVREARKEYFKKHSLQLHHRWHACSVRGFQAYGQEC